VARLPRAFYTKNLWGEEMKDRFWIALFFVCSIASLGCITGEPSNNDEGEISDSEAFAACQKDCEGCCEGDGTCRSGNETFTCGAGGALCTKCPQKEECKSLSGQPGGYCASCTGFTCDGCCTADDRCVSGTSDTECGASGQQCVACTGSAVCDPRGVGGGICR